MKTRINKVSNIRIKRIRSQGYWYHTDEEIADLALGNRFAYQLCTLLLIYGVSFANMSVLIAMMVIAFLSVLLPNHVFDYIYNLFLRKRFGLPKLPPRSVQLKFACSIATLWIGLTIYFFHINLNLYAYIAGALFISVALTLCVSDICLPSIIFNSIFKIKPQL